MADFQFLQNPLSKKWVISSPRRAKRPDEASGRITVCPFCPGRDGMEREAYRFPELSEKKDNLHDWKIRVLKNKFPFAPVHEVIIHSPDHHDSFSELSLSQTELIFKTYKHRFLEHQGKGQVYIFHNKEAEGGESMPHPHSQLVVIPREVKLEIPRLASTPMEMRVAAKDQTYKETDHFVIFCPRTSEWPDEVWIAPKERGKFYSDIKEKQITDLAYVISRLVLIFNLRHGMEFPFNFYIYPGGDWYIRLIPRVKVLGGFEVGTNIFVNTQDPKETIDFIKEHFNESAGGLEENKINEVHRATYHTRV